MIADAEALAKIQGRMRAAADSLRLPLRNHAWRGMSGGWLGMGTGSSIDFQDHRPYLPGDDPRYIDWQAFARSGNYSMKLYREEVSPCIDLAFDVSASMFLDDTKTARSLELFCFALASALNSRGALRCYLVDGRRVTPLPPEAALDSARMAGLLESGADGGEAAPALELIPWRTGSLRVWISDLLFPGNPAFQPLAAGKGRGVLLVPWCRAEAEPSWEGNLEMLNCESGMRRNQRVTSALLSDYRRAYQLHFQMWREHAHRFGVAFARVPAESEFLEALRLDALPNGAVEVAS
ncbi:MAG: DUF58 domain-containing protein [Chthoniobacteraceae bacterium]